MEARQGQSGLHMARVRGRLQVEEPLRRAREHIVADELGGRLHVARMQQRQGEVHLTKDLGPRA